MNHPPGTIATLSMDLSRFTDFHLSLEAMERPAGCQRLSIKGLWTANALNRIIAAMAPESAWLQIWSDDHKFRPDCLLRLLDRQVDLVAPFCLLRSPPFLLSMFHEVAPDQYQTQTWGDIAGKQGLLPVDTCGGPGIVIRREVLDAVGPPWFTGLAGEHPQEDLSTFARWRKAGFQPYIDLETTIGHITTMSIEPVRQDDGSWAIALWSNGMDLCRFPAVDWPTGILRESESK